MNPEERPLQSVKLANDRLEEIVSLALQTESDFRVGTELRSAKALGFGATLAALVYPSSIVNAAQLVHQLEQAGLRWRLLGTEIGSLLEGEQDFVGISLRLLDERLVIEGAQVRVHAGYSLAALVQAAAEHGLSGLEGLAGVTGSVGGALRNVTGLIGRYLWSVVEEVVSADRGGLEVITLREAEERELFDGQDLILAVTLKLTPSTPAAVLEESKRARHARYAATVYQRPANLRIVRSEASREITLEDDEASVEVVPVSAPPENSTEDPFGLASMIRERVERELHVHLGRLQSNPADREADERERLAGKFE
jgi:hypothetical protein